MNGPKAGRCIRTKHNEARVGEGRVGDESLASCISMVEKKLTADETISIYIQRMGGHLKYSKVSLL